MYVRRECKLFKVRNFGARPGIENHSPCIWDSGEKCEVATDNMPCVLTYRRIIRGDFSSSVMVAYYFSAIAKVPCYVVHKPGLNHPGGQFISSAKKREGTCFRPRNPVTFLVMNIQTFLARQSYIFLFVDWIFLKRDNLILNIGLHIQLV